MRKVKKNIARGTTDPGYWVYYLNNFSDWNQFEMILDEKDYLSFELNTLGPLCLWQCFKDLLFSIQDNILCSTNVMVAFPGLVWHPATWELIADIWIHDQYLLRHIILTICRRVTIYSYGSRIETIQNQ